MEGLHEKTSVVRHHLGCDNHDFVQMNRFDFKGHLDASSTLRTKIRRILASRHVATTQDSRLEVTKESVTFCRKCIPSRSLAHAGMDTCWIFACHQLTEQLFVLVRDPFPVVKPLNSLGCASAKLTSERRILFDHINLLCQLGRIGKEETAAAQHFRIELIVSRQHATSITQSVQ